MILLRPKRSLTSGILAIAIASSVLLASCGGGSTQSAGIGGTGIVAGKTTGFGSIYVNGSKFDTDSSQFIVDGEDKPDQSELAVGMYVKLRVETLDGNFTGKALEVVYDDEIEGPIIAAPLVSPDGTQKTFMVFGQTITVDDIDTIFKGSVGNPTFGFDAIKAGDVVEISGFRTSPTAINASYVEFKEDLALMSSEVELRGSVTTLMGTAPNQTFQVDGVDISTNGSTLVDVTGGLAETLNIEIKGIIQTSTSVLATKIELEDDEFDDNVDDIRLQGIVSDIASGIDNFLLGNQRVDASGAGLSLTLTDGMNIEVEGEIVAGKLIANQVEVEENETRLRSYIDTIDTTNFEFFTVHYPVANGPRTVTVVVDSQTYFEDDTGGVVTPPFSIDDLNQGLVDYVRVEGVEIANDKVLATVVKRTSPEDKLELEGEVDGYIPAVSITVLGIEYQLDGSTSYEPSTPDIEVGDFVEIGDSDDPNPSADGIADEVEEE